MGSATLFWRRRHGLMALVRMRIEDRSAIDVALIALPVTVALYCSSTSAVWITDPKYLVSAYPLFFLAVAAMLPVERKALYASLALLIASVVSSTLCLRYWLHPEWQISKAGLAGQSTLPDSRSRDAELKVAIDYLVHNGETAAYVRRLDGHARQVSRRGSAHGRCTLRPRAFSASPADSPSRAKHRVHHRYA